MTTALTTLLAHCERQRDAAQAAARIAEQSALRLAEQGRQLTDYRAECRRSGPVHPGRITGIDALRAQQTLLERIEQALGQHARQTSEAAALIARRHQALLALELRVASVQQLLARRALAGRRVEAQREQRQADDAVHAQMRARAGFEDAPVSR